ncbi:LiaI-LiaF-like domain-containing protein [Candidatus Korobacter versatilis]|nr:DUF5668 domain-containing protein [Candidatus Koribacter versatilis]
MAPAILVTMGVLFLLSEFGGWRVNFDHTWPMVLIVIGGVILAKRNGSMEGHVDPAQEYVVLQQAAVVANPAAMTPAPDQGNSEVQNG